MTFANFIFVIFILVSLLIFAVLILLMRQIKKDGRLPAEKMSTLAAVLFIPAFIIFALSFKGISTWRNGIKLETEQIKIESFVKKAYQPLSSSRQSLQNNLSQMQNLIQNIESMALSYPNHAELIQKVKQQWGTGQDALSIAYVETDREVRRAWIAHNTLDSQDVFAKFSKQAVYLESQIKKAEKDYDVHLHSVQGEMTKAVNDASQLIRALRKPAKSKKQQLKNNALREKIRPFNQSLTAELIGYVGQIDKRLEQQILTFQELIRISGQQSAILRDHLYQNPDLEKPLTKIINNWKTLESDSSLRLQQIFYAIEAEYVAVKLGLPEKNSAIEALRKNMRTIVPEVVGQSLKRRKAIDQSYNINRS